MLNLFNQNKMHITNINKANACIEIAQQYRNSDRNKMANYKYNHTNLLIICNLHIVKMNREQIKD